MSALETPNTPRRTAPSPAWQYSREGYKAALGVGGGGIFLHCSPSQYAGMSKAAKRRYDAQRNEETQKAIDAGREWERLVIEAYNAGDITLETPELHEDAKGAIIRAQIRWKHDEIKAAYDRASEANRAVEPAKGDRIWYQLYGQYITVKRLGTKTVSGTGERGQPCSQLARRGLTRLSPQDMEAQFLKDFGLTQEQLDRALGRRR